MRRNWAWALLVVLAGAAWFGLGTWRAQHQASGDATRSSTPPPRAPFAVEVAVARLEEYRPVLRLSAHAEAFRRARAVARVPGEVVEAPSREGAPVRAGDVLCRLDDAGARAELIAARAALASAERDHRAASRLLASGAMPEARHRRTVVALEQARARLRRARLAVKWRVITSPVDGVVQTRHARVGDMLSPGAACAEVVVLDPLKVVAHVTERDLARLRQGQPARARFTNGVVLEGTLDYIAPAGEVATRTFRLHARMANPRLGARAGMTALLELELPALTVARVPLSALLLADDGRLGVHVVDARDMVRFVALEIVREGREGVLARGLPRGARVIVSGQHFVRPGQKVRAVPRGGLLPLPGAHDVPSRKEEQPT